MPGAYNASFYSRVMSALVKTPWRDAADSQPFMIGLKKTFFRSPGYKGKVLLLVGLERLSNKRDDQTL